MGPFSGTLASQDLTELGSRADRRDHIFSTELARIRESDRSCLIHLPITQQRALLMTQHKQVEKARRTGQTRRTRLECAGNMFGRLGMVRLVRQPLHSGNVSGLNR